ncbi:MAG: N-acetyltransferase [Kofleriaceae bacterium]|nr:N-acetyltransferase [Kofleriaceae bacterium]
MDLPAATLSIRTVASVADLDRAAWDALDHGASPFLKTGFLYALEVSGSVSVRPPQQSLAAVARAGSPSGWTPMYVVAEQAGIVVGAVAAYLKDHSYGEYIFDWAWANASARAGLRYYPKIVVAAPATPASGQRILLAPQLAPEHKRSVALALIAALRELASDTGASSVHWLFCTADEQALLAQAEHWPRASFQFHWRNENYQSYEDFAARLKSRKRKSLRKERARAQATATGFAWVRGGDLTTSDLAALDRFYRNTTDNHGGRDYLRAGFFQACAAGLPDEMWMLQVQGTQGLMAGALFFEGAGALYGRYWGADQAPDFLHFETAYYQGIDRAIARRLPLFEAGAQGEHKLLRGFLPSPTYSAHWMAHPALNDALAAHCAREAVAVTTQMAELAQYAPYRGVDDEG